jgi:hypothetical protein
MAFQAAALPRSLLGYHRLLSPTAAVKVSPLCLGGMNFGDAWYVLYLQTMYELNLMCPQEGYNG